MKKKSKLRLLFFLSALTLSLLILCYISINFIEGAFIKTYFSKVLDSQIEYKNIKFRKRKLIIKKVKIYNHPNENQGKYNINIDSIKIITHVDIYPSFCVNFDIYLENPNLDFEKDKETTYFFRKKVKVTKKSCFKYRFDIKKAKLQLKNIDDGKIQNISIEKDEKYVHENIFKAKYLDSKNSHLLFCVNKDKRMLFSLDFKGVPIGSVFETVCFFNPEYENVFENVNGNLDGVLGISLYKKKAKIELAKLFFSEIDLFYKKKQLLIKGRGFDLELQDLKKSITTLESFKDVLPSFLYKSRFNIRTSFNEIQMSKGKNEELTNINGEILFNPTTGAKIDVFANIKTNDFEKKLHFFGKGYLKSSFSNWLDLNLCLFDKNEESKISLMLTESYVGNGVCDLNFKDIDFSNFLLFREYVEKLMPFLPTVYPINGKINCLCKYQINLNGSSKLIVDNLSIENLRVSVGSKQNIVSCDNLLAKFDFDITEFGKIEKRNISSSIDIKNANYSSGLLKNDVLITDAVFKMENGIVMDSKCGLNCNNILGKISLYGDVFDIGATLEIKSKLSNLDVFEKYPIKIDHALDNNLFLTLDCRRKENKFNFFGNIKILHQKKHSCLDDFLFSLTCNEDLLKNISLYKKIDNAWARGENIDLSMLSMVLSNSINKNIFYGKATSFLFYEKQILSIDLKGKDFKYKTQNIDVSIDKIDNGDAFSFNKNKKISINYDFSTDKIKINYPGKVKLAFPKLFLDFDLHGAKISNINKEKYRLSVNMAKLDEIDLGGDLLFDFSKNKPTMLFKTNFITGEISSLDNFFNVLLPFYSSKNQLRGKIDNPHGGFKLSLPLKNLKVDQIKWTLDAKLKDVSFNISPKINIANFNANVFFDSDSQKTQIEELNSNIFIDKVKRYGLTCPYIKNNKIDNEFEFDCRLINKNIDVFRFMGIANVDKRALKLDVDESKSHFHDSKISQFNFLYNFEKKQIDEFDFSQKLMADQFISQIALLNEFGIIPRGSNIINLIKSKKIESKLSNKIYKKSDSWYFSLHGKKPSFEEYQFQDFVLKLQKTPNSFVIDHFKLDDINANLNFDLNKNRWDFKLDKADALTLSLYGDFEKETGVVTSQVIRSTIDIEKTKQLFSYILKTKKIPINGKFEGRGGFRFDIPCMKKDWNFEANIDLLPAQFTCSGIAMNNNRPLSLKLSKNSGFKLSGVDVSFLDFKELTCKIDNIYYDSIKKKWHFQKAHINVPVNSLKKFEKTSSLKIPFIDIWLNSFKLKDNIDFICDVDSDVDFSIIDAKSEQMKISAFGTVRDLKDIEFKASGNKIFFDFKYLHEGFYYKLANRINLSSLDGFVSFFDNEKNKLFSPLTLSWFWNKKNGFCINDIKGEFCGIDASFCVDEKSKNKKETVALLGCIKIDMSKASKLLPLKMYDICKAINFGDGYKIVGSLLFDNNDLSWKSFKGSMYGKQFKIGGYQVKTLIADIDLDENNLLIKDFKVSDNAGILSIDKIKISDLQKDKIISIPSIQLREFRPSLLSKDEKNQTDIKPLLIKELDVLKINGSLNDKKSIKGKGHLSFINSFKRGRTIFDVPADMLSRIFGVDLEIMIPVTGFINYQIKDGKIIFTKLQDAYSESKRSKFFLLDKDMAYIDFDGNIHCNIKMKHYVLFKFTEPFVIQISGKIPKPKVNLQRKRGFLAS
jgi:hypothetical protein